jgi:murein DD-endopeptidase MepM/ murein hydrolase activator NlpD
MLAPRGTPIYAVVSGHLIDKHDPLGGNAASIDGVDGNHYYYAHLSAYEGGSRDVQQGEVIGYVGDTGDARGTNHLHFEVHPGGGPAVNPYPYVKNLGC